MYSFRKMFVMDRAVVSILEIFRTSCYLFLVQDSSLRKSPSVLVAVRAVRPRATDRAKQGGVKRGGAAAAGKCHVLCSRQDHEAARRGWL